MRLISELVSFQIVTLNIALSPEFPYHCILLVKELENLVPELTLVSIPGSTFSDNEAHYQKDIWFITLKQVFFIIKNK